MMFPNLLPNALQYLLASFLWSKDSSPREPPLRFELRHIHALANSSRVVFADVHPASSSFAAEDYGVGTKPMTVHRPTSHALFSSARFRGLTNVPWDEIELEGPDIQDRETLLTLAKMTNNAYSEPTDSDWYDLGPDWDNRTYPFGWEPDADGFRGHVFATPDNSTVVISVKGTSAGWLVGGGGSTTKKDKLNDNLLFSCCCARVGPTWSPVCGCYEGGYKCDQGCLEKSLAEDSMFYSVGTNLYYNVTYMYPTSNIWLVGHSLGGSLASLLGVTFGAPVVAFEAPGEKLAAKRLHLPSPPSVQHITHVYHTADPIAMGACNGVASSCAIAGYAMETKCHLGKVVRYDTVSELGWAVDIRTHGIRVIVEKLLASDWGGGGDGDDKNGTHKAVPDLIDEEDCIDCFNWEFGDYRNVSSMSCGSNGL
ncbi:alpha/beta-hydrolase [Fomitopsis serialis]|uniref:alpha/beta-hydrolase n=1 Tax=Fomitopsis serialis TaxID=139415 RepID=UPI002008C079|nr:alpha/beta-hydrolase [Neoantrodia serialis]KAH9927261.1 alpha/beta-hydrolase [Neoantrodia serialis]